jgi:rod shape-determining protein MreD
MRYIFYILAVVLLAGISLGVFSQFRLFGASPNLLLLFTLSLAVKQDNLDFYFIAFLAGIMLDVLTGAPLGSFATFFLVAGFVTHQLFANIIFYVFNLKHLPLLVVVSVGVMPLWLWAYSRVLLGLHIAIAPISLRGMELQLLPSLVYNILLMYPVYWFASTLYRWSIRLL